MRIVVYSKPFFPHMGGLERNSLTLSLALTDLGHEVYLFTETCESDPADETYPFDVIRSQSLLDLFRLLRSSDLFLVNGNVSLQTLPCALIQGISYGIIYHSYRGYRRSGSGMRTQIENRLRRFVAKQAAANIFTNSHARDRSGLPASRCHVILNPVDKRMEPLYEGVSSDSAEPSPLLFAGRIIEGKGVFVLLEALSHLDGSVSLDVVIAGEGPAEPEMRRRSESFETIDVQFTGRLDSTELVDVYQQARALVVPSTTHKEGNPLVVAESIFAGTPVIASDQPPMVESVGKAGIIVGQGDDQALAEGIRRVYKDDPFYHSLCREAQERRHLFGYQRYKEEINRVLTQIGSPSPNQSVPA
jgi:glycosyltransferase involved in cell wall biosynthesis